MILSFLLSLLLSQEPQYNYLVVVWDDVAKKDTDAIATPYLDALAAQGVTFTNAYANPTCATTRRSLFAGRWWITGNGGPCGAPDANTPPLSEVLLPEAMPGYSSALVGKWHLGGNQAGGSWECAPLTQGFDVWLEGSPSNVLECGGSGYSSWLAVTATSAFCGSGIVSSYEPFAVTDRFVTALHLAQEPWLTIMCHNLAHAPFHVPPSYLLPAGYPTPTTARAKFEAMVVASDELLGYTLSAVDLASTLVVVVGDNGTPPGVAQGESQKAKGTTFERGVKVPLVIAGGPTVNGGRLCSELVHVVDLWATGVALAGGTPTQDGVSLLPTLENQACSFHSMVLVGNGWGTSEGDRASVSSDGYKLRQLDLDGDGTIDAEEFYSLTADPGESANLIAEPAEQARITAHRAWIEAHSP